MMMGKQTHLAVFTRHVKTFTRRVKLFTCLVKVLYYYSRLIGKFIASMD